MTTLRVATFNIHHGVGADDRLDLSRTAEAIAALDADVVGLQEVDDAFAARSDFADQASLLATMLSQQVRFGAAIDRPAAPGQRRRRYGVALLTRGGITAHAMHPLPGHPGHAALREPRGLLYARVHGPGDSSLNVLVTHLDHDHRDHRAAQVLRILHHAAALEGPIVLLGDMNAGPTASELAPLAAAGWREAASEVTRRRERSAITSALSSAVSLGHPALRATFPARLPLRRLDSVWVHGQVRVTGLEVSAGRASDHRPVVATLDLRGVDETPTCDPGSDSCAADPDGCR